MHQNSRLYSCSVSGLLFRVLFVVYECVKIKEVNLNVLKQQSLAECNLLWMEIFS